MESDNTTLHNASHKSPSNNADSTTDKQNKEQQEHHKDQQVINSHSNTISKRLIL